MSHMLKADGRQFPTHIEIPEAERRPLIDRLNQSLACTFDLMSQVKQAHWNVKGKAFYSLHLLFDEVAGELAGFVDEIAERAVALGGYACGTVRMAADQTCLDEYPTDATDGAEHVAAVVERLGKYAAHVRESIEAADKLGDPTTADLYTQISRVVDKRLWFIEAHIQA